VNVVAEECETALVASYPRVTVTVEPDTAVTRTTSSSAVPRARAAVNGAAGKPMKPVSAMLVAVASMNAVVAACEAVLV
jgi:hypothetical protein